MYDSKYFSDEFITLLLQISKKKNWDLESLTNLFRNGIKIKIEEDYNNIRCHGAVIFNGEKRRCCRNKKIGNLCGLHFNKQKRYDTIELINLDIYKTIVISKNDCLLKNEKKKKIVLKKDIEIINYDECWSEITFGFRILYLNNIDNYLYTEIFGDFPIGIYDKYNNTYHEL
tara:strand:- start:83 stop:598 length:516 start_codon:yes stop_codon:yes gene_type:complete